MATNKVQNNINWLVLGENLRLIFIQPWVELFRGFRSRTIPLGFCFLFGTAVSWAVIFHVDRWIFTKLFIGWLYPESWYLRLAYDLGLLLFPLWSWGAVSAGLTVRFTKDLGKVFINAGLKNNLGKVPRLLGDLPLDNFSRKLRISNACFPLDAFQKAKGHLESSLKIYIDDIRESRAGGTVDITYSHEPMPSFLKFENISDYSDFSFLIGTTRSRLVTSNFVATPHLLVGGESGGGKSTFLRQFITTIYLNNEACEFVLIDLKGGLEFQLFSHLPRVRIADSIETTAVELEAANDNLDQRLKFLRENNFKDLEALTKFVHNNKSSVKIKELQSWQQRKIIVADEIAEVFLVGHHAKASDIQKIRQILSRIARQGRAVGIHLVAATQRPDVQSLDPQVKANLSGKVAMRMSNNASSMTVLDNGRAADLPEIPGRAIWKAGIELVEVQTPFLSDDAVSALLAPYKGQSKPEKKFDPKAYLGDTVGGSAEPSGPIP
jgi:hypothetical protein